MRILPLQGLKSVRLYQLYMQMLIAFAVWPTTRAKGITEFLTEFEDRPTDEKRNILRSAAVVFGFEGDDIKTILDFAADPVTGIEMSQQIQTLTPEKVLDIIAEVMIKCSEIKSFFWVGIEQKKSPTIQ